MKVIPKVSDPDLNRDICCILAASKKKTNASCAIRFVPAADSVDSGDQGLKKRYGEGSRGDTGRRHPSALALLIVCDSPVSWSGKGQRDLGTKAAAELRGPQ